jgi:hypothetical protein
LLRTIPAATFTNEEPPTSAEDLRICPYELVPAVPDRDGVFSGAEVSAVSIVGRQSECAAVVGA